MEINIPVEVAPSILSADFGHLCREIQKVESKTRFLHMDIMDGHFVPNITFGAPIIQSLRKCSDKIFDVHLMIENPLDHIVSFAEAGADIITLHIETIADPLGAIEKIHSLGKLAGLSLHPDTPIEAISPYVHLVDLLLVMSVRPGFGGQRFMPEAMDRIAGLRKEIDRRGSRALLSVDGGISTDNVAEIVKAGARLLVIGTSIFRTDDPEKAIEEILTCVTLS
jgi:ribulose-phosphate 3-epimerase